MNDLSMITWSHSSYSDVWPAYFGQIEKYYSNIKTHLFVDENADSSEFNCNTILNKESDEYSKRFIECLDQVPEKYVLYMQEDFILYDYVDEEKIGSICSFLESSNYSFTRLIKSGVEGGNCISEDLNLYEIPGYSQYLFSHQATIWKKEDLKKLYESFEPSNLRDAELLGSQICNYLGMKGSYVYQGEPKRGRYHYDSDIFPYVSTAIAKGKWDLQHYPKMLPNILEQYSININDRGFIKSEEK